MVAYRLTTMVEQRTTIVAITESRNEQQPSEVSIQYILHSPTPSIQEVSPPPL